VAQNDANAVTEDTALVANGNVLVGAGADTVGADVNATPVTPATVALSYGNLVLNADGSYTYTLNNANPAVNALNNGQSLSDSYTYTLTDGDGSSTTATLTITINGHTDGVPTIDIPDSNNPGGADGDKTVAETDGPIAGSFTISAPAGLGSLSVGGENFTAAQLADPAYLAAHPINSGEGQLVLTGYNPTTGVVSYTYDPAVQNHNGDVLDAIPVVVTDVLGQSTPDSLDITITDSLPVAQKRRQRRHRRHGPGRQRQRAGRRRRRHRRCRRERHAGDPGHGGAELRQPGAQCRRQLHLHAEQRQPGGQCAEQRPEPERQLHLHPDRRRRQQHDGDPDHHHQRPHRRRADHRHPGQQQPGRRRWRQDGG
jgi:VCBS repeat-containing protein